MCGLLVLGNLLTAMQGFCSMVIFFAWWLYFLLCGLLVLGNPLTATQPDSMIAYNRLNVANNRKILTVDKEKNNLE